MAPLRMSIAVLVVLSAMVAPSSSYHASESPSPRVAGPPLVMLWSLTPAQVADLVYRTPLGDYREVSPNAPVAARLNAAQDGRQHLHRKEVEVSQFHTQDGAGRSVFGYNSGDQVRVEARSENGRVRGSYSYRDPTGKINKVNYWDDGDGFHVAGNSLPSDSDIPESVTETPEVAAARLQHELMHAQALQASILADVVGEGTDQTRVEGPSGDLPPVYDEDGTELRRYPTPQHASLYDPSHLHDAERDAVIISNPDLEPDSFNDIQLFRSRARARGYHPRKQAGQRVHRQVEDDQAPLQPQEERADGFYYSFRYPAPVLVGMPAPFESASAGEPLTLSQRAVHFGAIPVAAVHDVQMAPSQTDAYAAGVQYSRKPVYTEPSARGLSVFTV